MCFIKSPSGRAWRAPLAALMVIVCGQGAAWAAPIGYQFDVTTFYQFGVPPGLTFSDFGVANPDTGYWSITNNGASTFTGTIGQVAVSGSSSDFSYSHSVTLAPGQTVTFAVNDESSNQGGYNGPFGSTQPGVQMFLNGTVSLGSNSEAVNLSVFDRDVHSGVFQTNPFGVSLDNYVLQGGDPLGRDTGDDFEVNQAPGHFTFLEVPQAAVPEPASVLLVGLGLGGLFAWRRKRVV